jgi:Ca2+-binding RTX toxin-like protein
VSETGTTDTFTVVLTKQPAVGSSVVLNVASSDASEATVAPTMLTFTPTNWNVPQVVTVTGVDDALQDGSQTSTITVSVNAASTTDNTFDTVANQTVTVSTLDDEAQAPGTAALVPDPDNPGSFILMVTGTSRNDTIRIRMNDAGEIVVRINGQREGVFQSTDVSGIQVSGRGGNDTINVSSNVTVPAELDGGAGNDNLNGGGGDDLITGGPGDDLLRGGQGNDRLFGNSGDDILLGGGGNDHLFGNGGRDMLIGDAGNDKLSGDAGQDILIGGATSFDDNDTALQTLLDEWTSDRTFDERVQNLQMGTGPILSGTGFSLSQGTTVLYNRAHDKLDGGAGQDLIFLSSSKGGKGGDDDDSDEVIPSANVQPNGSGNQGNDHSGGSANSHAKNNGNGNGHAKNKGKGKNKD